MVEVTVEVAVCVDVAVEVAVLVGTLVDVAVLVGTLVDVAVATGNTGAQAVLANASAAATAASALVVWFWPPPPPPALVDGLEEALVRLLLDVGLLELVPDDEADELDELDDAVVVSLASEALAWSRVALASRTAWLSGPVSSVASAWPAVTTSPTATDTPVTVPATGKCAVIWLTRVTDPVRVRVCSIDPVVT